MTGAGADRPRVVLLTSSPRLPAGLLTARAWGLLRTHPVLAGVDTPQAEAVRASGVEVEVLPPGAAPEWLPRVLAVADGHGTVVWLAGPDGDPEFARTLGLRLAREPRLAELELVHGSWDPPGARLLDAVSVIDRLVSPGGDPWKREQTHRTLAPFLLEECYEAYDAIDRDDSRALREELGDLLLQVVLHARLAEERADDQPWSIDDVAGDLVEKMIRRNPHVFAGVDVADLDEIIDNWERIKKAERSDDSALAGVPRSQPALALAAKLLHRTARAGLDVPAPPAPERVAVDTDDALGRTLFGIVAAARAAGQDPEAALRRAALAYADRVRAAEAGTSAEAGASGGAVDSAE